MPRSLGRSDNYACPSPQRGEENGLDQSRKNGRPCASGGRSVGESFRFAPDAYCHAGRKTNERRCAADRRRILRAAKVGLVIGSWYLGIANLRRLRYALSALSITAARVARESE